jgi:hypothetical protein
MTNAEIAHRRLRHQRLAEAPFARPEDAVQWLGAVQAQDYAGAKWAIGLRTQGTTDAAVDQALAGGTLLRTHVLRPTWHVVSAADIRWLLALTAPHVHAANAHYYRRVGFDDDLFQTSNATLARALEGGHQRTRAELIAALQRAGLVTDGLGYPYLLMHAELDAVICSGALRGKLHTYALLEERAPQARTLERDEALAELTQRYFTSHGPATLADYRWWSGLPATVVRRGVELVKGRLFQDVMDGETYWDGPDPSLAVPATPTLHLLPNFDEYLVGYTDRRAVYAPVDLKAPGTRGDILPSHTIVLDGLVVGIWKRTLKKGAVTIEARPFRSLDAADQQAAGAAAERYSAFVGLPVQFQWRQ